MNLAKVKVVYKDGNKQKTLKYQNVKNQRQILQNLTKSLPQIEQYIHQLQINYLGDCKSFEQAATKHLQGNERQKTFTVYISKTQYSQLNLNKKSTQIKKQQNVDNQKKQYKSQILLEKQNMMHQNNHLPPQKKQINYHHSLSPEPFDTVKQINKKQQEGKKAKKEKMKQQNRKLQQMPIQKIQELLNQPDSSDQEDVKQQKDKKIVSDTIQKGQKQKSTIEKKQNKLDILGLGKKDDNETKLDKFQELHKRLFGKKEEKTEKIPEFVIREILPKENELRCYKCFHNQKSLKIQNGKCDVCKTTGYLDDKNLYCLYLKNHIIKQVQIKVNQILNPY